MPAVSILYRATTSPTNLHKNLVGHVKVDGNLIETVRGANSGGSVVSYVAGKIGNACNYAGDGTSSGFIQANHILYSMTDGVNDVPYSFSYWIRLTNRNNDGNEVHVLSKDGTSANTSEWMIVNLSDISQFRVYSANGTSFIYANSGSYLAINTWYHVVCTYDGSKLAAGLKIYINGVLNTAATGTSGTYVGTINRAVGLYFGCDATNINAFYKVKGYMDEITLWKGRILTDTEIAYLYNSGNGRKFPF